MSVERKEKRKNYLEKSMKQRIGWITLKIVSIFRKKLIREFWANMMRSARCWFRWSIIL